MLRKRIVLIGILIVIITLLTSATTLNVVLNGESIVFNAASGFPFIDSQNRTQVPFRIVLESFGASVEWDEETQTAIARKGDTVVYVPIGKNYILRNDQQISNDTVAVIKDGRTYLPIRAVMEAFDMDVGWNSGTSSIVITDEVKDQPSVLIYSTSWCGYCKKAKAFFEANDIAYTELDIEKDQTAKDAFEEAGYRGVPTILVDDEVIVGFNEERLRELLLD